MGVCGGASLPILCEGRRRDSLNVTIPWLKKTHLRSLTAKDPRNSYSVRINGSKSQGLCHLVEKKTCWRLETKYFHNGNESAKENTFKLLGRKSE